MNVKTLESHSHALAVSNPKDQLSGYILGRSLKAFKDGQEQRERIITPEQHEKRKAYMQQKMFESLGGLPHTDAPLNPRLCGTLSFDGYRIEKIIFEARPKVYVTSNLYIPDGITVPQGAVLFVCGHHEKAKHQDEYQIVCRHLVKAGLIVFAIDPVGQGERVSYYDPVSKSQLVFWGVPEHEYAGEQCHLTGTSIARYFVHDAMRAIDYLCTRPEVDPSKIGVTGNSGGGTQTSLMMLCDKRIAAAAPATFIMDRESYLRAGQPQDAEQIWVGMTAAGFDHEDILLGVAPKPVLVLAVTNDFFPIEATRKTVQNVSKIYEVCGKPENIEMFEVVSEHMYTPAMAVKAAEFFSQHLLGKKNTPDSSAIKAIEPSELHCTSRGIVSEEFSDARFVYHENKLQLDQLELEKSLISTEERTKKAVEWLKGRVFNNRAECTPTLKRFRSGNRNNLSVESCIWWSQEGLLNHAYTFRTVENAEKVLPVTIAVWEGGTRNLLPRMDWIYETCNKGRCVLVFDNSGVGNIKSDEINTHGYRDMYGTLHTFTTNLFWLDDSLCALRVYETIKLLDVLQNWHGIDSSDITFHTVGRPGLYTRLAAFIDPRINKIDGCGGISSFKDIVMSKYYNDESFFEYIIPGILKYM